MPFTEQQHQQVQRYIDQLPRKLTCPACGDHTWSLQSFASLTPPDHADAVPDVVPIVCRCCGHITFFSAQIVGLKD